MFSSVVRSWTKFFVFFLILCSALVLVFPLPVLASQSITLAWNPSPDKSVASYNIYYGKASGSYSSVVSATNASSITISGLVIGTTYYFAATSVDAVGDESGFSNETSYKVPFPAVSIPTTPVSTNPIPTAALTAPSKSANGQFGFTVAGVTSRQYVVQASTNLVDWVFLQTNTAPFTFVDVHAANFKQRFYRTFDLALYTAAMTPATLTAPASSSSALVGQSAPSSQFSFNVTGTTGQTYVVQASTNLVDWVSIQTNTAPFVFTDTNAAAFKQRFFRTFNVSP